MEHKIGEIFEYNGEWYQCIEDNTNDCTGCDLAESCPHSKGVAQNTGSCSNILRNDGKSIIFKKLERVGEPITKRDRTFQCLKALKTECVGCVFLDSKKSCDKDYYIDGPCHDWEIWVEIKQNKEDMKEKKIQHYDCFFDEKPSKSNLKPFDLEAAKAGKSVCTRDGRKARIICFDRKDNTPIVALIECVNHAEILQCVHNDGKCFHYDTSDNDLMMLLEKKEGWVNVYKRNNEYIQENICNVSTGMTVYESEGEAKRNINRYEIYVDTVKITWEE